MKSVVLDAQSLDSRETLHATLAQSLDFPTWYGNNLDALFDCLTSLSEEVTLVLPEEAVLSAALGPYGLRFLQVCQEAARENGSLRVVKADGSI